MRRYRDYDAFAWLYANTWGDPYHRAIQGPLNRLVYPHIPKRARILDLCCGDGRLAALLTKRGHLVTGIDGSEEMLTYARQRSPQSQFLLADARSFDLPPIFHCVLSTFDSLNHVMTSAALSRVFERVYASLRPGGIFVFDLNRAEAYATSWLQTGATVTPHLVSVSRGTFEPKKGIAICDITLLRQIRAEWVRSDFQLRQKHHPAAVVLARLRAAGFSATVQDAAEVGMQGEIGQDRSFYFARKPKPRS